MEQVAQWLQTIFGEAWRLMCSVTVPGLGISAAQLAVGFFSIVVGGFTTGAKPLRGRGRIRSKSRHKGKQIERPFDNEKTNG